MRITGNPMKYPTESAEQITVIQWFRKTYPAVLILHVPNGGYRSKAGGEKLKLEGVVAGIPDLFIPEWNLWIEMKREKGGSVSPAQKKIINYLNSIGQTAVVCRGHKEAIKVCNHTRTIKNS